MILMMNNDIKIPEGTSRQKYNLFGIEFPLYKNHDYELYREALKVKVIRKEADKIFDKIFCMPGDLLIDLTEKESTFFAIDKVKE